MPLQITKLELTDIDRMTRPQLLDVIQTARKHLPDDLFACAEDLPVDHLRLLVLVARFVCVLRILHGEIVEDHSYDNLYPM
jgi:hypothetical protein